MNLVLSEVEETIMLVEGDEAEPTASRINVSSRTIPIKVSPLNPKISGCEA